MKRGRLCIHLIYLTFLFFSLAQQTQGQSAADLTRKLEMLKAYPDLIVVNGKIATMDESLTQVQAMAVKNNRILALGRNDTIRFLAGPNTEVLDAKGRLVLPGMIDVHTHPNMWGVEGLLGQEGDVYSKKYNDPQLKIVYALGDDQATVLRELERLARQRAQEVGPGKWIWIALFGGKSIAESARIVNPLLPQLQEGRPGTITREYLDRLAPNNALSILQTGPNNTKAKELMEKYSFRGIEINSYMQRNVVLYDILLRDRVDEAADFAKNSFLAWAAQGFTAFSDHYYGAPSIMAANNLLYQKGEMPIRWAWFFGSLSGALDIESHRFFYRNLGDFRGIGNDYIWNGGVANESWDGGDNRCTKAKRLPGATYTFAPDCSTIDHKKSGGYINVKAAMENKLRISYIHAGVSDGTYDALFELIEELIAEGKITLEEVKALRISTDHNPMIRPDQIANIAKYNVRVGFTGWQSTSTNTREFLKAYGEEYMRWMTPMKSLVSAGARVFFGGDFWLGRNVPYYAQQVRDYPPEWSGNIWPFIAFFVTRKTPDGMVFNLNESIDRVSLMRAFTNWPAENLLREKHIGSLEVGKLADFIVISKDFFTVPDDQIPTIKTLLTVLGGKVTYKDPSY